MLLQLKENMELGADGVGSQEYERWKEEADELYQKGITSYRLNIEWARMEPKENEYDKTVITHYRKQLHYLKQLGIHTLLSLHHFKNPVWFDEKGGFSKPENARHYLRFVKRVVQLFGELVSEYLTFDEPALYAVNAWYYGILPPGGKSFKKTMDVMSVLAACHVKAYKIIHRERAKSELHDTKVSFGNYLCMFEPKNAKNPKHMLSTKMTDWALQKALTKAMCVGDFDMPLRNMSDVTVSTYCDFLALNSYAKADIAGMWDGLRRSAGANEDQPEVFPEAIVKCAEEMYAILERPIYIMEDATWDNKERFEDSFVYRQLKALSESDLPVERYYHSAKRSGEFYQKMAQEHGVTEEMYAKYIEEKTAAL